MNFDDLFIDESVKRQKFDETEELIDGVFELLSGDEADRTQEYPIRPLEQESSSGESLAPTENNGQNYLIQNCAKKDKEFEVQSLAMNKILKAALPEGINCTKDVRNALSKAAGFFILYITKHAHALAKSRGATTIGPQDVSKALEELGYASFLPYMEAMLRKLTLEAANRKFVKEKKKEAEFASKNLFDSGNHEFFGSL